MRRSLSPRTGGRAGVRACDQKIHKVKPQRTRIVNGMKSAFDSEYTRETISTAYTKHNNAQSPSVVSYADNVNPPYDHDAPKRRRPWKTTWVRFGPLSGIFCMILAVLALIASLGILAGSDGASVDEWSATPAVSPLKQVPEPSQAIGNNVR